ncbi:MAG: HAMP domain-containing histidine kinase [Candidatus Rokubacteria bacterium]|nr:HAMP domain-containing histidine kinase [Candidatus Rokubacteria bacterium]MBI3826270.1 HAMP domain-containing histidine kinase [Candidatus Rokubacteria bacterium]
MSPLARYPLLALAGIVLPAVIVAVLGFVSLRQWESSAEALFREQARDMASMAAEKIAMLLDRAADEALGRLDGVVSEANPAGVDALLAGLPLVQRAWLFDRQGRMLHPAAPAESDAGVLAALLAEVSQGLWEGSGRRRLGVGDRLVLVSVLRSRQGRPVLVALAEDPEWLRHAVLDATLKGREAPTICAVLDERGRPVYTQAPLERARFLASAPLPRGFPAWRVAIYEPPGLSARQSVRRQVMVFTVTLGVLVVVIAAGVLLTHRLLRRETEMARLKSDFVANVSHDLKTPLSVIRMFGETLEMGRVSDEASRREYYRVITRESERLSRLIDNVLDFSRIESGRRVYEFAPTPIEPLVRETLDAFAYPLAQQGFKVQIDVDPDLPEVPLDAAAAGQALANLVDNAIKYSGERKSIAVTAAREGDGVALTVADEGMGIPAEEHARIFEKFYRVGRSETQARRGSGVGLALVRHVAEAHGGRVTVRSRPGEGSRFTLWLPTGR